MPGSICDVFPSAAALLGVPAATDVLGLAEHIGDVRRVAVLLVDGMGWNLLPQLAAHAPLLASVLGGACGRLDELACVFPSMTATNLASLGTGVNSGEHGILGLIVERPGSEVPLNHLRWHDDPPPTEWQPVPTWCERLRAAGVGARAVVPAAHVGSGLTEAALRGAKFYPAASGDDYAGLLVDQLRTAPGLIYGYTPALDIAAHAFGVGSAEWHAAGARIDELLNRLVESLPSDAALLITADHGGLNIPTQGRIDLDADSDLRAGVRLATGDPRVRYLHTEVDATADVIATWTEVLDGRADILARDDAVTAGWFGPVPPEHLPRIGDVVVVCTADIALLASRQDPPEMAGLVGFHGAATPAEMAIPLIAFRG